MVLLGDAVTETVHQVMAAVFNDDPQPLYDIILDREADQFIRSMTRALLAWRSRLERIDLRSQSEVCGKAFSAPCPVLLDGLRRCPIISRAC